MISEAELKSEWTDELIFQYKFQYPCKQYTYNNKTNLDFVQICHENWTKLTFILKIARKKTKVLCYGWMSFEILFSNSNIHDIESKIRGSSSDFHKEKGFIP